MNDVNFSSIHSLSVGRFLELTLMAVSRIRNPRFFQSERAYQGELYCALKGLLIDAGIVDGETILEMEYQKISSIHDTTQRPDIVLHIPRETFGAQPDENNLCVWALKREANAGQALEDFKKLDTMFSRLKYPAGVFVNIQSEDHFLQEYSGDARERIAAVSVRLLEDHLLLANIAYFHDDNLFKNTYYLETP